MPKRCISRITSHNFLDVKTIKQYLTRFTWKGSVGRHLSVSVLVLACKPMIHNTNNQYCIFHIIKAVIDATVPGENVHHNRLNNNRCEL